MIEFAFGVGFLSGLIGFGAGYMSCARIMHDHIDELNEYIIELTDEKDVQVIRD